MQKTPIDKMQDLVGQRLAGVGRSADMLWLALGEKVSTRNIMQQPVRRNHFALHLQCPWRFVQEGEVLLGSEDIYYTGDGEYRDEMNEPRGMDARFDDFVRDGFFEKGEFVITQVKAATRGDLVLQFSGGLFLETFVNATYTGRWEPWRLVDFEENEHYVMDEEGRWL